jgi:hypothetical protein
MALHLEPLTDRFTDTPGSAGYDRYVCHFANVLPKTAVTASLGIGNAGGKTAAYVKQSVF